jgi:biopolymer transport protein ExbD
MKFPRNARIFRGQLDVAPFATVLFLLVMFLFLASLVYTPGIQLHLPLADNLPGTEKAKVSVAIDADGRLYYENQLIDEVDLKLHLRSAVSRAGEPLILVISADQAVRYDQVVRLALLAREAGLSEAWLATLPRAYASPALRSPK